MNQRAIIQTRESDIQTKRREIQIRREKAHAISQYKRMAKKAQKGPLASKEAVSINHAIFFTIALGVASILLPQLSVLAVIFSILILGNALNELKKSKSISKGNISNDKMLRMIQPDIIKLSSKKRIELPIAKTLKGLDFEGEDGSTIKQFDWRQITQ